MHESGLSESFQTIDAEQQIFFSCHPGVSCFTECCRELDLALTPYDVLRLKRHLGIPARQFLDQYVIVEWEEGQLFPLCYLSMVDDGRASCVFVNKEGCTVYADRPGSCRAYPLGRGASRDNNGKICESLVFVKENHCQGFLTKQRQSADNYLLSQDIAPYRQYNDALLPLIQHPRIQQQQFRPSPTQLNQYMLALYNLDQFREELSSGHIVLHHPLTSRQLQGLIGNDEELLLLGVHWLMQEFFIN